MKGGGTQTHSALVPAKQRTGKQYQTGNHGPAMKRTDLSLEKRGKSDTCPGCWDKGEGLTQGCNQYKGLQHDIMVQASLGLIKEPPFLLGKVHSHVLKGHRALNRTHQRSHSSRVCRRRRGPGTAAPVPARRQILAEWSPRRASDPSQDSCTSAYPARYTSRRHRVPKIPTREPISPNVY